MKVENPKSQEEKRIRLLFFSYPPWLQNVEAAFPPWDSLSVNPLLRAEVSHSSGLWVKKTSLVPTSCFWSSQHPDQGKKTVCS